jgi:alpha-mannosidase
MGEELAALALAARKKILAGLGGGAVVFNDLSWERSGPVTVRGAVLGKAAALKASGGIAAAPARRGSLKPSTGFYVIQRYKDIDGEDAAVFSPRLPSLGWSHFTALTAKDAAAVESLKTTSPFAYTEKTLRTPFYRLKFDKAGRITGLYDIKGKRELVAPGGVFNGLVSADDVPILWEAWDIDSDWTKYLKEETRLLSTTTAADGPVCFILRRKYAVGAGSTLTQDTIFYAEEKRIDFVTKVDWKETHRLLKVGFNTALDATQVRCEVQYGHLLRNTHKNLPHDRAKFEICAHKWISMEEEGGGVALLNDCKYGHDVSGGSMRLTLLRSPKAPDENADIGEQRFTYSILPFSGSFGDSGLVRKGYELNSPAVVEANDKAASVKANAAEYSLFSVDGKAVIAESVKGPESGKKKTLVVRLYESLGGRAKTVIHFNKTIASASAVDMLEENPRSLRFAGKDLPLNFRGFEIKTILVTFK